jgi:4-oxalocrotonate tautomerase
MASLLGKRADLTVVAIGSDPAGTWSANGSATARAANLQAFITAGTNTDAEKAAFLAAARCMMEEVLGESTAPMYVVLSEVAASDWGYDGLSQAQRRCDAH